MSNDARRCSWARMYAAGWGWAGAHNRWGLGGSLAGRLNNLAVFYYDEFNKLDLPYESKPRNPQWRDFTQDINLPVLCAPVQGWYHSGAALSVAGWCCPAAPSSISDASLVKFMRNIRRRNLASMEHAQCDHLGKCSENGEDWREIQGTWEGFGLQWVIASLLSQLMYLLQAIRCYLSSPTLLYK